MVFAVKYLKICDKVVDFMVLIVGGASQGKERFATDVLKKENIYNNLHIKIKELLLNKEEEQLDRLFNSLLKYDAVICDELGCGVVPVEEFDRSWREVTGRMLCSLGERADEVWRVTCGIGVRIK